MQLMQASDNQTMSSREIAELTGKQHKHVIADIRTMCEQMEIDSAEFSAQYKDSTGRTLPCFKLDRYHTEVLVTGYDVKRRAAVIKRWYDLESGAAQPMAIKTRSQSLEIIEDGLAVAGLLGVPTHYAQIEVVKEARRVTGVDYSRLLEQASAQDNVPDSDVMLEPSDMAPLLKLGSAAEVNRLLAQLGLQYRQGNAWLPTKKGEAMCSRHSWTRGTKSGYNLKWNLAAVRSFIDAKG